MSGPRAALRVAGAESGVGWIRLCDYSEPVAGELARREPAVAGVPVIFTWSGRLTVDDSRFDAGFVAGPADRFADTLSKGHAQGVQVDLTWLGARRLLGLPLGELAYRRVAVDNVWGPRPNKTCGGRRTNSTAIRRPSIALRGIGTQSTARPRARSARGPTCCSPTRRSRCSTRATIGSS